MDVGSLFEAEDQCGMAHFLEHMAFNSTKHYPGTEKIEYLQRLGMGFGADTNAFTSFDQTVYKLELPRASEELTSDGIKLLRDYFDGMLLDAKEIDKERGVVLSEILSKDGPGYRTFVPSLDFSLPDTLVSRRMPVNDAPHVKALKHDRFVDFYETWSPRPRHDCGHRRFGRENGRTAHCTRLQTPRLAAANSDAQLRQTRQWQRAGRQVAQRS